MSVTTTAAVIVGASAVYTAFVAWSLGHEGLCRRAARVADSPLQTAFGLAGLVGFAAIGASLAKLFALPLGTAGLLLAGPALALYAHVELYAAAHGFRSLGLSWEEAGRRRLGHRFSGWVAYVSARHATLPWAFFGLLLVAFPATFVLVGSRLPFAVTLGVASALSLESALFAAGTGYNKRHLLPDGPREDVSTALD